jgi:HEAT repeats
LMKFLTSPNGDELATAVTALGYIGYDASIPQIEQQLRSADWRVTYAAARSLGWLGATGSVPELERVASGHWLPEVRNQAVAAVDALKGDDRRLARPGSFEGRDGAHALFSIGRFSFFRRYQPSCGSRRWEWHDIRFSLPPTSTRAPSLWLGAGALIGSNRGEWGGELAWSPVNGQVQSLIKHKRCSYRARRRGSDRALRTRAHVYGPRVRSPCEPARRWRLVAFGSRSPA